MAQNVLHLSTYSAAFGKNVYFAVDGSVPNTSTRACGATGVIFSTFSLILI